VAKPKTGPKAAAEILKGLDEATRTRIFSEIQKKDPKLADIIQNQMFLFDDLLKIENSILQAFLLELDRNLLALALRKVKPELKDKVFEVLPKRLRQELEESIASMGPKKISDVETAQKKIADMIYLKTKKDET